MESEMLGMNAGAIEHSNPEKEWPSVLSQVIRQFMRVWTWIRSLRCVTKKRKQLTVQETTAMGERRLISVIQFERQRFLVGSTPSSITLLSRLPDAFGHPDCGARGNGERRDDERGETN